MSSNWKDEGKMSERTKEMKYAFWQMLGICEAEANNYDSKLLQLQVEAWYRLWNESTGDDRKPRWVERAETN